MKRLLVSLAVLASMGLTACEDMGYGYGHHHHDDGGYGDHRGDRGDHDGDRHDGPH